MKNVDEAIALLSSWAQDKIDAQQEPPWAWEQYHQLLAVLDGVKEGREAVILLEDSLESERRQGSEILHADRIVPLDSVRRHPSSMDPVLPM